MFVGDKFKSNRYGEVEVIKYEGKKSVTIRFLEYNNEEVITQAVNIRRGLVAPNSITVKTLSRWKEVSTNNHNSRYDYSRITTKPRSGDRVDISCRVCGTITNVDAEDHLLGRGYCPCVREEEVDVFYSSIIEKSPYEISRSSVLTREASQLVTAICPEHGEFSMTIKSLLSNGRCPTCELAKRRVELLKNKENILTGVEVLGFTTDYDYILLDVSSGEIKIYTPTQLSAKENSPFVFRVPEQRVTFDVFKQRATVVHGDAYSYSDYLSIKEKVTITHKVCGNTYKQAAAGHINGNYGKGVGCPHCAKYGLSLSRPTNLYILLADNGYVKVGITHQTPEGRIRQIHKSTRSMFLFECYKSWNMIGKDAVFCEHEILKLLRQQYKQPSETFDGSSETFVGTSPSEITILIEKFLEDNNIELLV